MSFSGRPSWKNGDKTSCNNEPQRTSNSLLSAVHDSLGKARPNMLKVQRHWDPQTIWHCCSYLSPFTNRLLCTFYLALCTLPPPFKPTRLIDIVGESSTSQHHTALYLTAFIIVSFWIISSYGLARMTDTFLQVEQLQPGSPACPGKPCFTACQMREGRPSVWPRGCTNTA